MSMKAFVGADIFDGQTLHHGMALLLENGVFRGIAAVDSTDPAARVMLDGGTISPGFVDLQVNGGGGVMFNDHQTVAALETIARAHASTGTAAILPTLITDTPAHTTAAIEAVEAAIAQKVPGIIGLHLEGPHLSQARKGAHDPALIRPMGADDLAQLCAAARRLPNLMMTLAPESVTPAQIAALTKAGVIVSLGHSDCSYADASAGFAAGARVATHLFNAMSPLGSREPGLVGAVLDTGPVSVGLIADGIHVHPASIRSALAAKRGPGRLFLVTDAMSTVGSSITEFTLNGRRVLRRDGRLTLENGSLAGADLDMPKALSVMVNDVGIGLAEALAMATTYPAAVLTDACGFGQFAPGLPAHAVWLKNDFSVDILR
ncbi:N-acetylglucosamine-6-phosphate deacetylase [Pseudorhodobacter sp.]|uniref:N-acetylglucosamine-6-phosphate deacetylase n=1 Tax=Pseudorhodobacter sp. TaxID=1934400 RepID=UPI002648D535|nr:N-acetylglucosamine-6-phosphate deacetylase [Pseudorhodobacter sp.]MDN5787526.1 N-acetylglucosamine-6-phosphate deacetylase [Pseudorhodobacter sp.]